MLAAHEMMALALILKCTTAAGNPVPEYRLCEEMRQVGYTELATRLSVVKLSNSELIKAVVVNGKKGRKKVSYAVTKLGEEWLIDHEGMLQLRVQYSDIPKYDYETYFPPEYGEASDDDIPF